MASGKAYLKLIIKNGSHEKVIPFLVTPYGLHEFSVCRDCQTKWFVLFIRYDYRHCGSRPKFGQIGLFGLHVSHYPRNGDVQQLHLSCHHHRRECVQKLHQPAVGDIAEFYCHDWYKCL